MAVAGENRFVQIHEMEELRHDAYESSKLYMEHTKTLHDARLKDKKEFRVGDRVLLYNSRLKLFPGKLKSQWSGPYNVRSVFPYETVEIGHEDGRLFKVNGHRLKAYVGGPVDQSEEVSVRSGREGCYSLLPALRYFSSVLFLGRRCFVSAPG
ncbi:uncharacterized protein LOC110882510 [Helianthus annuus]|uniref:uncharacterized protein LOC110882510 n=1 Tax=Helianthus annuus TaxID=4232 RepID=UPI000B8FA5F8|nr:uncharacterized protein LOC110882510 [Helianthus annuus]